MPQTTDMKKFVLKGSVLRVRLYLQEQQPARHCVIRHHQEWGKVGNLRRQTPLDKAHLPTSLGMFTPTGRVVLGFASDADMASARKALRAAKFAANTIAAFSSSEVVAGFQKLRPKFSKVAPLFNEWRIMRDHYELARQGGGFLVVYAPSTAETQRVVRIANKFRLRLAHKYNRLSIQTGGLEAA